MLLSEICTRVGVLSKGIYTMDRGATQGDLHGVEVLFKGFCTMGRGAPFWGFILG